MTLHSTMSANEAVPNGMSSPTLTNPEMILPFDGNRQSRTPSPPFERLPSPPRMNLALNSHPPSHSYHMSSFRHRTPPPRNLWQYSDHEPAEALSDIEEVESTPKSRMSRRMSGSPPLISAPTHVFNEWQGDSTEPRRFSGDSGIGENDEVVHWEGFDTEEDGEAFNPQDDEQDEENDQNEQDEHDEQFDTEDDRTSTDSTEFDDKSIRNSHAFGEDDLDKRAELILANAKKRLTSMEGKLSQARDSLVRSPTPTKQSPPFSMSIGEFAAGRGNARCASQTPGERRVFNGSSLSPGHRQSMAAIGPEMYQSSHETSRRSASALGQSTTTRNTLLEDHTFGEGRIHVRRASTSQRNYIPLSLVKEEESGSSLFDQQNQGLGIHDHPSHPLLTRSQSQNQMRGLRDQMNDLKGKISTLKARAREDNLRRRSLQSLRTPSPFTNAADPEQWYSGAPEYQDGGLNTNAGYGWSPEKESFESPVMESEESTVRKSLSRQGHEKNEGSASPTQNLADSPFEDNNFDINTSPSADQIGLAHSPSNENSHAIDVISNVDTRYEDAEEPPEDMTAMANNDDNTAQEAPVMLFTEGDDDVVDGQVDEEAFDMATGEEYDEEEDVEEDGDEVDSEADLESLEAVFLDAETAPAERHEDRADAFDYEHFFLHSALGNYHNSERRQSTSESSESSVETTRALTPTARDHAAQDYPAKEHASGRPMTAMKSSTLLPPRAHHRNDSVDSISTMATFATATEGNEEEDEDGGEGTLWNIQTVHPTAASFPTPEERQPSASNKADSWPPRSSSRSPARLKPRTNSINIVQPSVSSTMVHVNGYPTPTTPNSAPATMSGVYASPSPQPTIHMVQALMAADAESKLTFSDVDRELVEKLVESLGKVCVHMGNAEDGYESKVWRRRLDSARRVLEGELDVDADQIVQKSSS